MDVLKPYIQYLLPDPCYDEFLIHMNLFDVLCWKVFISKCLGYAIILGSVLVKLPQIIKIATSGSGKGLSMLSLYLEMVAFVSACAYGYASNFPFSAFGDSIFLIIQNAIITSMVLFFNNQHMANASFLIILMVALYILLTGLAPYNLIWALQASNMPIVVASKMIQAVENYKNSSTGQLSAITVVLLFFGSLARVFTSIQETGDMTLVLTYIVATSCNGIILAQVLYYWNSDTKDQRKKK